jgi:hypothetical protein
MTANIGDPSGALDAKLVAEKVSAPSPEGPHYENDYDADSIEGEVPTEEEYHTLRRVPDKIPWRVYTIALVELCERFSYYGTTVVCESYSIRRPS